jgi:transcriptional regulator
VTKIPSSSLYGTVDLLILRTLFRTGSIHGLGIAEEILTMSRERVTLEEGALYPALHRLEKDGYIKGAWKMTEKRRRARFYELTARGRKHLESELARWTEHTSAMRQVLGLALDDLS